MSQCRFCGTRTGQHGFAFGPDGSYSTKPKEVTWRESEIIRINALKELLSGIRIVGGHVQTVR